MDDVMLIIAENLAAIFVRVENHKRVINVSQSDTFITLC